MNKKTIISLGFLVAFAWVVPHYAEAEENTVESGTFDIRTMSEEQILEYYNQRLKAGSGTSGSEVENSPLPGSPQEILENSPLPGRTGTVMNSPLPGIQSDSIYMNSPLPGKTLRK